MIRIQNQCMVFVQKTILFTVPLFLQISKKNMVPTETFKGFPAASASVRSPPPGPPSRARNPKEKYPSWN